MKKILWFIVGTIIGVIILINTVYSTAQTNNSIKYIVSNEMDFNKCKVIVGDWSNKFTEEGDWLLENTPIETQGENEVSIIIQIKLDGEWIIVDDIMFELDQEENEFVFDYVDDNDNKLNVKIVILCTNIFTPTPTETLIITPSNIPTETAAETKTPTQTPKQTPSSTPTNKETIIPSATISHNDYNNELPKTGEGTSIFISIIACILIFIGVFLLKFKNRHQNK